MSCQHEWTESIRCAKCGQTIESRLAVGRLLDEAIEQIGELRRMNAQLRADVERFKATLADSPLPEGI